MHKLLIGAAVAAGLLTASAANAAINVKFWFDEPGVAGNATFAGLAGLGAADGSTTVPLLNFSTGNSDATTIDQFLGTSIGGATGGHILDNTVFEFTGSTFLNAGDNSFVVPHDDGLQLLVAGNLVINQPGPTGAVNTPFIINVPTAGLYSFDMVYGECCSGPAVIAFQVNGAPVTGGVPEPATWAMMLAGFGGLGAMMRRRRAMAVA